MSENLDVHDPELPGEDLRGVVGPGGLTLVDEGSGTDLWCSEWTRLAAMR